VAFVARKDLSRTVIEGGRYRRNRWERRASHGVERASTRAWLDEVSVDHDVAEEFDPPPIKPVAKSFYDKLAPAQRWLQAQVGRPWSKVYSELRARFDSRTIAGQHIVKDHMLGWVQRGAPKHHFSRYDLYVDEHGILRKPYLFGRGYASIRKEVATWAAGRTCAHTFRGWWWFRRDFTGICHSWTCTEHHFKDDNSIRYHALTYVPVGAMTRGEQRYLDRLPGDFRRPLIIASPWA
jgi:hypothetical protein